MVYRAPQGFGRGHTFQLVPDDSAGVLLAMGTAETELGSPYSPERTELNVSVGANG